jgi:hypothetical protein
MAERTDRQRGTGAAVAEEIDTLASEFAPESRSVRNQSPTRKPGATPGRYRRYVAATAIGTALIGTAALVGLRTVDGAHASLSVETDPPGAEIHINGELRGTAPLALTLAPGTYELRLGRGAERQQRLVTLAAGERMSVYDVVRPAPAVPAAAIPLTGTLSIVTEPTGSLVTVDGINRGAAPVTVSNLTGGDHQLVVRSRGGVYRQTVTVQPGSTSTVVVGTNASVAAGWLTVQTALPLQIYEAGRLLGITESERLMLPAGDHQLTFADQRTGFQVARSVRIEPGGQTAVTIQVPRAPVNVNAIPWAEVWMANERLGETPIGNVMLPLGPQQLELRHPELGTKRVSLLVSLNGQNRVSVNMREK